MHVLSANGLGLGLGYYLLEDVDRVTLENCELLLLILQSEKRITTNLSRI